MSRWRLITRARARVKEADGPAVSPRPMESSLLVVNARWVPSNCLWGEAASDGTAHPELVEGRGEICPRQAAAGGAAFRRTSTGSARTVEGRRIACSPFDGLTAGRLARPTPGWSRPGPAPLRQAQGRLRLRRVQRVAPPPSAGLLIDREDRLHADADVELAGQDLGRCRRAGHPVSRLPQMGGRRLPVREPLAGRRPASRYRSRFRGHESPPRDTLISLARHGAQS